MVNSIMSKEMLLFFIKVRFSERFNRILSVNLRSVVKNDEIYGCICIRHIFIYVCTYTNVYVHMYICIHTHTYIHVCIYIYIYTYIYL
jgi:hypothetical protein